MALPGGAGWVANTTHYNLPLRPHAGTQLVRPACTYVATLKMTKIFRKLKLLSHSVNITIIEAKSCCYSDVPEYEPTNVELNYGLNNKVWTVARKYLLLTSHSEEEVEFNLNVTSFNPSVMLSSGEKAWFR